MGKYIRADIDHSSCYDSYDTPEIVMQHFNSLIELLRKEFDYMDEWGLQQLFQEMANNPKFIKALKAAGFVNLDSIKDREEKIKASKRFYIIDANEMVCCVNDLSDKELEFSCNYLVKGTLVQEVGVSCLKDLAPKAYQRYLTAKKRSDTMKKASAERKAKTAEKKKQKEIERAKKLLQDAGELS